jgi:UDP-2,3-diacylglucosamine pyrophosphatase LpxH
VLETAKQVPFDDSSRFVFFSDCHRGDNSQIDAFAKNKNLFLHALTHYYREGFTYVEVGDGDELWHNRRFSDVRQAHERVFDLLHQFDQQDRLHLIVGNHDIQNGRRNGMQKDGIIAHEGLVLRHSRTGQRVFAVHGHQADLRNNDRFCAVSRFVVRHILKPLGILEFGAATGRWEDVLRDKATGKNRFIQRLQVWQARIEQKIADGVQEAIERRIIAWLQSHWQITICGHTHRPKCAAYGTPYFNAGSCIQPGYITGLEIRDGEIALIRWSLRPDARRVRRTLMAPPRKLRLFSR